MELNSTHAEREVYFEEERDNFGKIILDHEGQMKRLLRILNQFMSDFGLNLQNGRNSGITNEKDTGKKILDWEMFIKSMTLDPSSPKKKPSNYASGMLSPKTQIVKKIKGGKSKVNSRVVDT